MPNYFAEFQQQLNEEPVHEWHATFTVALGELIENGAIDFSDDSWSFDEYSKEQRDNFYKKFKDRFYFAEIVIVPPLKWQKFVVRTINENMAWLKFLYKIREALENKENLAELTGEYEKYRKMLSEFPQTMLSANNDYASAGEDLERERVFSADLFDIANRISSGYADPDIILLNLCEKCFMPILTADRSLSW